MHIHIGVIEIIKAFFGVILVGTFWRIAAMHLKDTAFGQAMAFIY